MEEIFNTELELQEEQTDTEIVEVKADENADSVEDTEVSSENAIVSEEKPAKKDTLNAYEQVILAEMQRRAEDDEQIANGLASKDKDIHECFSLVKNNARKKAVNGCAMIEDAVVFGWAVHYYTEPKSVIDAELHPKQVKTETTIKPATKPATKSVTKPTKADAKKGKKATYNDNPLLKSLSKKKKSDTKQKGTEKTREVKKGGNVFTITEFTLF